MTMTKQFNEQTILRSAQVLPQFSANEEHKPIIRFCVVVNESRGFLPKVS